VNRRRSALVSLSILALSIALAAAACGSPTPSPSPSPRTTSVDEAAFHLALPGDWATVPSSDSSRWVYRNGADEQVTVSVVGLGKGLSRDERMKTMRRVLAIRRRAETEAPGATPVKLTATQFGEADGILAARYGGSEPATGRHLWCLVLGGQREIVFVYYESLGMSQQQSDARARTFFNSVSVPR
jgi:hypothetical protein